MAKKDWRVNEHGIDVADLKVGQWITVRWNDEGDIRCLLVNIELRPKSYKGTRRLAVMEYDENRSVWFLQDRADHDQVVAIHGMLSTQVSILS
jgi:hypothetical protein